MQLEVRKYLFDIEQAAALLLQFVAGKTVDDYLQQPLLQPGVERQFEIIGEAINQLAKLDLNVARQITDYQKIISFRNILIHGYAEVDDLLVWDIVETRLPVLYQEIQKLSASAGE
jgi:uncharacterized protein with HEPN domain